MRDAAGLLDAPESEHRVKCKCAAQPLRLHDHDFEDQQEYERQERNRLMNQGSFTDKSGCEACAPQATPNLYQTSGTGTELRPD